MNRPTIVAGSHKGDDMRGIATSIGQRPTLAPYQNRSCIRCGEHTIFVLDDPAGGWYACIKCGRYACRSARPQLTTNGVCIPCA
jgi:PHP family Zn ribbon phosphoesterase